MSEHDEDEWTCPKPGCTDDIDAHDFARFLRHAHYDEPEFTAEDAQQVADRTLAKVAAAFGLTTPDPATPTRAGLPAAERQEMGE